MLPSSTAQESQAKLGGTGDGRRNETVRSQGECRSRTAESIGDINTNGSADLLCFGALEKGDARLG